MCVVLLNNKVTNSAGLSRPASPHQLSLTEQDLVCHACQNEPLLPAALAGEQAIVWLKI